MFKGFRDFILRGNAIDLAVGVIIGAAFGAVVSSLSADVITPIIGMIFGKPDFSTILIGPVKIGNLLNALVNFLITAVALYFFIVAPLNVVNERLKPKAPAPPPPAPTRACPECLSTVPAGARRCAFCTSELR
ncbi:MAG: large conductance mechanosensitive channel protein MscL [Oscillochloris sp.]|nr:large conductance mechanosensitive channel protein MscL [Oscillochloris sp.]